MSPPRGSVALPAMLLLSTFGLVSCGTSAATSSGEGGPSAPTPAVSGAPAAPLPGSAECAARVKRLLAEPELPGAPAFEAKRIDLVGRPRGTPLLWKRVPAADPNAPPAARAAITKIEHAARPVTVAKGLVRRYGGSPAVLRATFLREGYVFSEDPEIALALVETLKLTHLFREPQIHLLRGRTVHVLRRTERTRYRPESYVHAEGPWKGAVAELLLGDRVAIERADVEKEPIALDLSSAAADDGFDRLRVKHLSEGGLVAEVHYAGSPWITAAFDMDGAALKLACADGTGDAIAARAKAIQASEGRRLALAKITATVRAEVQEQPRFDEPKDEPDDEQQDGALRREWRRAYGQGLRRFSVGEVLYDVYDEEGRPVPPQVCVDFITDTWERASGTWYKPLPPAPGDDRPKPAPERTSGGIDFDKLDLDNRRSVAELVTFAKRHREMFDVLDLPQEERIPFVRRSEFFAYLAEHEADYAPGDVIVIHGVKSDGRPHYHSVIVMERDPITGVPVRVAGNAGRPREQTLEGVMARSPKRSIKHRLRPKAEWLAASLAGPGTPPLPE